MCEEIEIFRKHIYFNNSLYIMKANKVLLATIATVSILTVSITSVSAYGQGNGQGR